MNGQVPNNTAKNCPVIQGHGNRNFTDYRLQQDLNNFNNYGVSNNNQYRLLLQRNGQAIIDQNRMQSYKQNQCNSCDRLNAKNKK